MSKSKTLFFNRAKWFLLLAIIPMTLLAGGQRALADPQPLQQLEGSSSSTADASGSTTGPCDQSKHKLTALQIRSCKCDGTPNLTESEVKGCEACQDPNNTSGCLQNNPIVKDINSIIKILSGLVAVVVTGAIIMGGIQYAMAGDKADGVAAAKKRIINGLTALVVFILIFSIVQWLIPGGIFNK